MGDVADAVTGVVDSVFPGAGTVLGGITGAGQGDEAADAARQAAATQAQAQQNALNYLREREQVPRQFSESALQTLGGLYGFGDRAGTAANTLRQSPIYDAIRGNIGQQEEAILRNQSATGALRTSGTEQMLAENQRRNEAQALQASMQGLQGLAGLPSYAPQIAGQMAGIGQTQAQGITAGAQAQQQGQQNTMQNLFGVGQLGLAGLSLAGFSDRRLKTNVERIGESQGLSIYRWDWNEKAAELGLYGEGIGVMADEIERFYPERIEMRQGYKYVKPAEVH